MGKKELIDLKSQKLSATLQQFWKRWRGEYLVGLREKHYAISGVQKEHIGLGDIVIVHEDLIPKSRWTLAVVTKLLRSSDGIIRSTVIRTANGITNRPISKLYPLEVQADVANAETLLAERAQRPKRLAAQRAMQKIVGQ